MLFALDRLAGVAIMAAVIGLRALWPERGMDAVGPVALRDAVLSLALLLVVLSIAIALGQAVLRALAVPGLTGLETALFTCALGLGALGLANLALGLIGWLNPEALAIQLLAGCAVFGPSLSDLRWPARFARRLPALWQGSSLLPRLFVLLAVAIGGLAAVSAFSPPWDYDGLMYHLVGPKQFLAAGRVFPDQDNWYVNGPFGVEMLFSYGLAFGDDVFPKLLHFSTGIVLVLATYAAGRRWLGNAGGWLAAAILLGVPTLPIWASFAYIDLAWSAFEFLALFAGVIWAQERQGRWLTLSGILIGLAMASKYLGLMGLATLGILVILADLRRGFRATLSDGLRLCLPAAIVAAPWYVKNMLWFGNPVYPLYFGGPGWDSTRLSLYSAYLDSYGVGKRALDFLLLPWNVYAHHERFGAVMNRIDVPSFLFPLLLAYLWLKRRKTISLLLAAVVIRSVLWAIGSQQLRFLMPVYPAMAIGVGFVVLQIESRLRAPWSLFLPSLAVGLVLLTLFYQVVVLLQFRLYIPTVGLDSRKEFVERIVLDMRALESAPSGAGQPRTLMLGDGRGYYCLPGCLPDPDHFRWASTISRFSSFAEFERWAETQGIGQVLLNLEDLDFLLQHDPLGVMQTAMERISSWRAQGCLPTTYSDEGALVLSIRCP